MLCTVTVDVDNTDGVIAFLNCINDLSYIDVKFIEAKEEVVCPCCRNRIDLNKIR